MWVHTADAVHMLSVSILLKTMGVLVFESVPDVAADVHSCLGLKQAAFGFPRIWEGSIPVGLYVCCPIPRVSLCMHDFSARLH